MNMEHRRTRFGIAMVLSLLIVAASAAADEYHYVNTFVGDRAAGLAGAYTAIADGPEGMYYNPAGIAFAPGNYFSVSTNAFEFRDWLFKDLVGSGVDFNRNSFALVPNFFGFIQRAGRTVWGFTIVSPDARSIELRDDYGFEIEDGSGNTLNQRKFVRQNTDEQVFEVGPSAARLYGDRLALGITLLGGYSINETTLNETNVLRNTSDQVVYQVDQSDLTKTETVWVRPTLGLQYSAGDDVVVGYVVTAPVSMYSQSERYNVQTATDGSITLPTRTVTEELLFSDGVVGFIPIEQRLGIAWFASPELLVSADARVYVPVNGDALKDTERERPVSWNAAVGLEYFLAPTFPLRLGVFTNNANTDSVTEGDTNQPEHVDLYGGTATIGLATSDLMLNIGGAFSMGTGKGQIIGGGVGSNEVQVLKRWSAALFVSGGYRF